MKIVLAICWSVNPVAAAGDNPWRGSGRLFRGDDDSTARTAYTGWRNEEQGVYAGQRPSSWDRTVSYWRDDRSRKERGSFGGTGEQERRLSVGAEGRDNLWQWSGRSRGQQVRWKEARNITSVGLERRRSGEGQDCADQRGGFHRADNEHCRRYGDDARSYEFPPEVDRKSEAVAVQDRYGGRGRYGNQGAIPESWILPPEIVAGAKNYPPKSVVGAFQQPVTSGGIVPHTESPTRYPATVPLPSYPLSGYASEFNIGGEYDYGSSLSVWPSVPPPVSMGGGIYTPPFVVWPGNWQ